MPTTDFSEHIRNIRNGDQRELNDLISRWRPILRLHARGLLGSDFTARADSSDILQETLTQAVERIDQFDGQNESQWGAWLYRILKNEAAYIRRKHLASKRSVAREANGETDSIATEANPLNRALAVENAIAVAAAIERLPSELREVVVQRAFHQNSFDEIGASVSRSAAVVRVMWARALRKLQTALADSEENLQASV